MKRIWIKFSNEFLDLKANYLLNKTERKFDLLVNMSAMAIASRMTFVDVTICFLVNTIQMRMFVTMVSIMIAGASLLFKTELMGLEVFRYHQHVQLYFISNAIMSMGSSPGLCCECRIRRDALLQFKLAISSSGTIEVDMLSATRRFTLFLGDGRSYDQDMEKWRGNRDEYGLWHAAANQEPAGLWLDEEA